MACAGQPWSAAWTAAAMRLRRSTSSHALAVGRAVTSGVGAVGGGNHRATISFGRHEHVHGVRRHIPVGVEQPGQRGPPVGLAVLAEGQLPGVHPEQVVHPVPAALGLDHQVGTREHAQRPLGPALADRGVDVPGDVSVAGFDDQPVVALWRPALTTVDQDFEDLGARAFALLARLIAGEARVHTSVVVPQLVVRESTAAPPR